MFATAQNFCVFLESEIFYMITLMFCSSCQNLTFSQLDGPAAIISQLPQFAAAKNLTKRSSFAAPQNLTRVSRRHRRRKDGTATYGTE